MDVEIVEFYPIKDTLKENGYLSGTLHVYVIDLDLDVRGFYIKKSDRGWVVRMPQFVGKDINGESYKYPSIDFTNREKQKSLIKSVRAAGRKYIEENYIND